MSYRVGNITRKLARDFNGIQVELLHDIETKRGTVFAAGPGYVVVEAWKGRLKVERTSDGARVRELSGFDVVESLTVAPTPAAPAKPGTP